MSVQVSAAGRDNFLAAESDKTMALMIECCSETKVATALLAQVQHKSPTVRAKVASHLDSLMQGEHGTRLAGLPPKRLLVQTNLMLIPARPSCPHLPGLPSLTTPPPFGPLSGTWPHPHLTAVGPPHITPLYPAPLAVPPPREAGTAVPA